MPGVRSPDKRGHEAHWGKGTECEVQEQTEVTDCSSLWQKDPGWGHSSHWCRAWGQGGMLDAENIYAQNSPEHFRATYR